MYLLVTIIKKRNFENQNLSFALSEKMVDPYSSHYSSSSWLLHYSKLQLIITVNFDSLMIHSLIVFIIHLTLLFILSAFLKVIQIFAYLFVVLPFLLLVLLIQKAIICFNFLTKSQQMIFKVTIVCYIFILNENCPFQPKL